TRTMQDIYNKSKRPFVVIIDEWDCVFREFKMEQGAQEKYLDFLRDLLKDKAYIHLAYMTGILPIKKYGTHSALNMFDEFSMLSPGPLASYVGFTENEVSALCQKYEMDLSEIKNWYDGYSFSDTLSIYSPRSVVNSMLLKKIGNYWNQTETFEALQVYIDMNFDSLKDDILSMIAGENVPVNTGSFTNDMTTFRTEDDVLTLLIHLGYLSYDNINKCVFIPNEEVRSEYINAVSVSDWGEVSKALIMM
ncbi:MAG: AAA family ATPase, partial [Roseburia inulinivorans]